jgi:hypothetical protein
MLLLYIAKACDMAEFLASDLHEILYLHHLQSGTDSFKYTPQLSLVEVDHCQESDKTRSGLWSLEGSMKVSATLTAELLCNSTSAAPMSTGCS